MIIYYDYNNDICISLSGDMNAEPDMIIHVEPTYVVVKCGDIEQEFELGMYITAVQEGDTVIIDFDASTPDVDGLIMDVSQVQGADTILIQKDGEIIAEVTEDGVKDAEEIADEKAAAEGKTCKIDTTYFDTLKEAIETAQPNAPIEIKMIADENGAGIGLFEADGDVDKDITIDFREHTYTASSPAVGTKGTQSQALHLEKGNKVTLKNGTFAADPEAADIKMLIQNYCDLTLDNMVCDCSEDSTIQYVSSNNFGNCLIKNSVIAAAEGKVALDCWFGLKNFYDDGLTVTAQNTQLVGNIEYGAQKAALNREGNENWYERTILTLTDCDFTQIVNSGAGANEQHTIIIDGVTVEQPLPIVVDAE